MTPEEILAVLRQEPRSLSELSPELRLAMRQYFSHEDGFSQQQRNWLEGWYLVVPDEALEAIAQFNEVNQFIQAVPVPLADGRLVLPASLLTDEEHYARSALPILENCLLVELTSETFVLDEVVNK